MESGVQNDGVKDKQEGSCEDIGATLEGKNARQSVKPSTANEAEGRDEAVTGGKIFDRLKTNDFRCALSGVQLQPDDASLDHTIPLSVGGRHTMGNVAVIHNEVNRMKGEMNQGEFVRWCKLIARWNS